MGIRSGSGDGGVGGAVGCLGRVFGGASGENVRAIGAGSREVWTGECIGVSGVIWRVPE